MINIVIFPAALLQATSDPSGQSPTRSPACPPRGRRHVRPLVRTDRVMRFVRVDCSTARAYFRPSARPSIRLQPRPVRQPASRLARPPSVHPPGARQ